MGLFKNRSNSKREQIVEDTRMKIGTELNFAAKEAYKGLRTNLTFMICEGESNVFGVTSSISGEGKSLSSINLSVSFAEMGKKTLLVECDMRKPVVEKYFNVKKSKGLSNVLAGHCALTDAVHKSARFKNLFYISAGEIPPNPTELLSSHKMQLLVEKLSHSFDVVILDLPPVTAVSDAVIVSKYTKGMLLVVRDSYIDKDELSETIRQLQIAEAKILGFVYNVQESTKGKYYKKGYKYYEHYSNYEQEL